MPVRGVFDMKLWASLYLLIWLGFFAILLSAIAGMERSFFSFLDEPFFYLHIIIGIAVVIVAGYNANELQQTEVPMRIKRVARAAFGMAMASGVTGVIRAFDNPYICYISFFHIVVTIAMITQASSVATAYDMWEEKEFEEKSAPGVVLPRETPGMSQEQPKAGEPPEE